MGGFISVTRGLGQLGQDIAKGRLEALRERIAEQERQRRAHLEELRVRLEERQVGVAERQQTLEESLEPRRVAAYEQQVTLGGFRDTGLQYNKETGGLEQVFTNVLDPSKTVRIPHDPTSPVRSALQTARYLREAAPNLTDSEIGAIVFGMPQMLQPSELARTFDSLVEWSARLNPGKSTSFHRGWAQQQVWVRYGGATAVAALMGGAGMTPAQQREYNIRTARIRAELATKERLLIQMNQPAYSQLVIQPEMQQRLDALQADTTRLYEQLDAIQREIMSGGAPPAGRPASPLWDLIKRGLTAPTALSPRVGEVRFHQGYPYRFDGTQWVRQEKPD